jgi:hypothetical protein
MKTIGFVDYYINEWHANNYPAWFEEICRETNDDFVVKYVWAELEKDPSEGKTTDEWCKDYGVEKCATLQELCEKADYILVLSPDNPEKHLEYASEVLKYGKNTYIDKTFAPDYATAKKIFDLGEKYGTKFFSSSALRYAEELDELVGTDSIVTLGGGRNVEIYIIHQIEMVVKTIREKPIAVRVEQQGTQYLCSVKFEKNKGATMIFSCPLDFCAFSGSVSKTMRSPYFKNLLADILRFFKTGEYSFEPEQTLTVMKIRDAVIKGKQSLGEWITL